MRERRAGTDTCERWRDLVDATGEPARPSQHRVRAVDGEAAAGTPDSGKEAARQLLAKFKWPYSSGFATTDFLDRLEMMYSILLHDQRPFPVPTSFLIDSDGWLTGIYRGAVSPEQVLADLELTRLPPDQYLLKTTPFEGRWAQMPLKPGMGKSTMGWVATAFEHAGNMNEALDLWRGYLIYDQKIAWPKDPREAVSWNQDLAKILYQYTGRLHFQAKRQDVANAAQKRIQELIPKAAPGGDEQQRPPDSGSD